MRRLVFTNSLVWALAAFVAGRGIAGAAAEAASFVPLAPGTYSDARAISADGTVVVGNTQDSAFRWSAATGLVTLVAGLSQATGVSGDGSIVVGYSAGFADGNHFFRWTNSSGVQYLGRGTAYDISADGKTIVGSQFDKAFSWTAATGLVQLNPTAASSTAEAVSADGSVIVGSAVNGGISPVAGRWTAATGWVSLGLLPGGASAAFPVSSATAVSANGATLGGFSTTTAPREEAFRWTQETGMVRVDSLAANLNSRAIVRGVSADGSILVGEGNRAFIWTALTGTQDLRDYLIANGATGLAGWTLWKIGGISSDGRWVSGSGTSPSGNLESWIAELSPVPIPAAAWLFGGAIGLLGTLQRRKS